MVTLRARLRCSRPHHLSRHLPQAHLLLMSLSFSNFAVDFYFGHYRRLKLKTSCGTFLNLAHYFLYDIELRLLAHSRSFLANQKARNAIVRAENLLNFVIQYQLDCSSNYINKLKNRKGKKIYLTFTLFSKLESLFATQDYSL